MANAMKTVTVTVAPNTYLVTISKADLAKAREVLIDTLDGTETDEDIITEMFYQEGYRGDIDLRARVRVKKIA